VNRRGDGGELNLLVEDPQQRVGRRGFLRVAALLGSSTRPGQRGSPATEVISYDACQPCSADTDVGTLSDAPVTALATTAWTSSLHPAP
jgi:hypothetical protein